APDHQIAVSSSDPEHFADSITIDTSRQSLSLTGIKKATEFHRWLKERQLDKRVSVAGISWDQRKPSNGATAMEIEVRDAHVILPGGLYTLRSALKLIQAAKEWPVGQKPSPIYLVNPKLSRHKDHYFWDGLHDALENVLGMPTRLRQPGTRDWTALTEKLSELGVHVVESEQACQEMLSQQFGVHAPVREISEQDTPDFVPPHMTMPADSTLFFATTSRDKLEEMRKLMQPYGVRVARMDMLTPCNSPEEKSGTYTGNCSEKMREAVKAVREMQTDRSFEFQRRLRAMKVNPAKAFILVEDAGLQTIDKRVFKHLDKRGFQKRTRRHLELHPDTGIGPEFGPATIGSLGERAFFENLNRAFDAVDKEAREASETSGQTTWPANRKMIQTSVLGLAPLLQPSSLDLEKPETYDFQIFSGIAKMKVRPTVQAAKGTVVYTAHFLEAIDKRNPDKKTQIELDHEHEDAFLLSMSARSKAAKGMITACRTPLREQAKLKTAEDYTLSLYGDVDNHVGELLKQKIDSLQASGYQVQKPLSGKQTLAHSIESTLQHSDATLLMPFAPERQEEGFVERLYTLFSHIVARQIHPRDRDKPLIVFNPKEGEASHCWSPILAYFDELRDIGMITDQTRTFVHEVGTLEAAMTMLQRSRQNLLRTPQDEPEPHTLDDKNLKASGKYNVAVFCSATNKNEYLLDLADTTGAALAMHDYGIVYGAGDRAMMGAVLKGALNMAEAVKEAGKSLFIAGSSTEAILTSEASDPKGMIAHINANGQYFHAKDIYERMSYMIKQSNSFLILPGGAGTVQELGALLMLKQNGHPDMAGKDIVVLDLPYNETGDSNRADARGFFSGLLEQMSPQQREALGIHVVKSQHEAMQKLAELRQQSKTWAVRVSTGAAKGPAQIV
ncbi:MAG: LOG family protein, partial [Rickettsiales bacterium]|nr:LOG family protein [Rickettsiales bacterium]